MSLGYGEKINMSILDNLKYESNIQYDSKTYDMVGVAFTVLLCKNVCTKRVG